MKTSICCLVYQHEFSPQVKSLSYTWEMFKKGLTWFCSVIGVRIKAHCIKNWNLESPRWNFGWPVSAFLRVPPQGTGLKNSSWHIRRCPFLRESHGADANIIMGVTVCVWPELSQIDLHGSYLYKAATMVILTVSLATHARRNQIYPVGGHKVFFSDSHP